MARDPIEQLVDATLPARWPAELARELASAWRSAARRHGKGPTIRRIGVRLEAELRDHLGDPEPPRVRLRARARTLVQAGTAARAARAELDALAERLLAPRVGRAERISERATEELLVEDALAGDAKRLHRLVVRNSDDIALHGEIVDDEACALGTALLVYWLSAPHYYRQFASRRAVEAYNRPRWDLLRRIEQRIGDHADPFRHCGIVVDPRAWAGRDWTVDAYPELPRTTALPACVWIRTTAAGVEPISMTPAPTRRQRRAARR